MSSFFLINTCFSGFIEHPWLKQTCFRFPFNPAKESLSVVYFWLRVRGSVDRFPSSAHWCCFKLGVYQRLIFKNGRIWGRLSITGAESLVFSLGPITFDESLLKTPLGKAWPAFALAQRHFFLPLRLFLARSPIFQSATTLNTYFGLLFVCSGWTTINFMLLF